MTIEPCTALWKKVFSGSEVSSTGSSTHWWFCFPVHLRASGYRVSLAMFYEYLEDIFSWHVTGLKCIWLSIKHICMHVILPYVLIEMSYCLLDLKVYSWLHRNIGTTSRHRLSTWSKLPGSWSLIHVTFLIQHQVLDSELILAIIRFRYHLHS